MKEIAKLAVLTAMRPGDEALTVAAYADKLAPYPADIIVYVFGELAETENWFPSWKKMYEPLEFWVEARRGWLEEARHG